MQAAEQAVGEVAEGFCVPVAAGATAVVVRSGARGRASAAKAQGVDETTFLSARAGASTQFVTGIVAMPGPDRPSAQLLDVVPGRIRTAVQRWFTAFDPAWRQRIRTASLDPYRGYATALTAGLCQGSRTGSRVDHAAAVARVR